jgi:glutamate formiminotransferase/formiminotetrahydrofolate cyclodeaminase
MEDCIVLARQLGERVREGASDPGLSLRARAASRPDRENLADVRRGEFEGLRDEIGKNPNRKPDFGPDKIHATAGAVAIGARPFLGRLQRLPRPASNMPVAKEVAKAVRGSSGGLRYVKGHGFEVDGQAQVSMNLVDTEKTPLHRAFDMVKMEAAARGVNPTWSEIVGLVPERALFDAAARHMQLRDFTPDIVLERKVREAIRAVESMSGFVAPLRRRVRRQAAAAWRRTPAHSAPRSPDGRRLTMGKKKYVAVDAEMREIAVRAAALGNTLSASWRATLRRTRSSLRRTRFPLNQMRSRRRSPRRSTTPDACGRRSAGDGAGVC